MASLKPPDFPIATPNQEDLKGLTLFLRVHEKLSELWLGIDKCLLSQATAQGAGDLPCLRFRNQKEKHWKNYHAEHNTSQPLIYL